MKNRIYEISELKKEDFLGYDVLLGMSGGTDSTFALDKLKKDGYNVCGIYLYLFDDKENTSLSGAEKAEELAGFFGIKLIILDARRVFKEKVQKYFVEEYLKGRTPNPCGICNRDVKMEIIYEVSNILDIPYIATGHYVGIKKFNGYNVIIKGEEKRKEQSYFLSLVPKEILQKCIFPLQNIKDKEDIKKELEKMKVFTKAPKDSEDICFLTDCSHEEFGIDFARKNNLTLPKISVFVKGKLYSQNGKNVFSYTIGKRKGHGISYTEPLYVESIEESESKKNTLNINLDTKENLFKKNAILQDINILIEKEKLKEIFENEVVLVKTRYTRNETSAKAKIDTKKNEIFLEFLEEVPFIAKGQIGAIYFKNMLIAGGIIK